MKIFSKPENPLNALWHYKRVDQPFGKEYLIREDGAIFTRETFFKGKGNTKWSYVNNEDFYPLLEGAPDRVKLSELLTVDKSPASPRLKKRDFAYIVAPTVLKDF